MPPAAKPMASAPMGPTKPLAGVMATSPATAPDAAPTVVAFPCLIHSGMIQPSTAVAVARWVATNALPARAPDVSALPALNPNQPNHRMAAPSTTNGTLCGTNASFPHPRRFPRYRAHARAATPALMCTTVPPAKSSAPRCEAPRNPPPHTQCATGEYTMIDHSVRNISHPENFIRSAKAPVMRAGVMTANISWNAMNTDDGMVGARAMGLGPVWCRPQYFMPPISIHLSGPKASV